MAEINGHQLIAYVDTGASVTLLAHNVYPESSALIRPYKGLVADANGNNIEILGSLNAKFTTPDGPFATCVLIFHKHDNIEYDFLLGMNILKHSDVMFSKMKLIFDLNKAVKVDPMNDHAWDINIKIPTSKMWGYFIDGLPHCRKINEVVGGPSPRKSETDAEEKVEASPNAPRAMLGQHSNAPRAGKFNVHLRTPLIIPANTVLMTNIPINKQLAEGG